MPPAGNAATVEESHAAGMGTGSLFRPRQHLSRIRSLQHAPFTHPAPPTLSRMPPSPARRAALSGVRRHALINVGL